MSIKEKDLECVSDVSGKQETETEYKEKTIGRNKWEDGVSTWDFQLHFQLGGI